MAYYNTNSQYSCQQQNNIQNNQYRVQTPANVYSYPQAQQNGNPHMPSGASYSGQNGGAAKPASPYKYPRQLAAVKRDEHNFYIEAALTKPQEQDLLSGELPGLDGFGKSRFDLFIFKYAEKVSLKFSLSIKEMLLVAKKTDIAMMVPFTTSSSDSAQDQLRPAYTVRLRGGNITNGKTAAEVLAENPANRDALLKQRDWYASKASDPRYGAGNAQMMDAINEAVYLFDTGQLNLTSARSSSIEIYKKVKTPNNKKTDQRGLTECRSLAILYRPGEEMAFQIEIMNCMAPPLNRSVGANLSQARDKKSFVMTMTEEEWNYCVTEAVALINQFRELMKRRRFEIMTSDPFCHL